MMSDNLHRLVGLVDDDASEAYRTHRQALLGMVDDWLLRDPRREHLLGGAPPTLAAENHANHHRLMGNVFALRNAEILLRVLPWVFSAYQARGFSSDYFDRAMQAWRDAVWAMLPEPARAQISAVYDELRLLVQAYAQQPQAPAEASVEPSFETQAQEVGGTGQAPNRQELGGTGQAPNQQELGGTGQAPNQQELGGTGQAPNQQELGGTGQAPNRQEAKPISAPEVLQWFGRENEFLQTLLKADSRRALQLAQGWVSSPEDLRLFYSMVVHRVMVDIGRAWQANRISVAQEHLATAIVSRVMSTLFSGIALPEPHRGRAMVTCAAGELHELGGRMVADALELDGWDTDYLGANTPIADVLDAVERNRPRVLGISVAMPFHLTQAVELISALRERFRSDSPRIMLGGRAMAFAPLLWKQAGADGLASTVFEATRLAARLVETRA
ncbi:MAG: cobalamin-dependent protein [Myxococcota bacterium]|jgi:methanogenic corrinoid protein MtbC1|nr:cobalamin-dependent protein [Myxococcota bacterium]